MQYNFSSNLPICFVPQKQLIKGSGLKIYNEKNLSKYSFFGAWVICETNFTG